MPGWNGWKAALSALTDDVIEQEFEGLLDDRRRKALAARRDTVPIGILYENPEAPCYDDFTNHGLDMSVDDRLVGLVFARTRMNEGKLEVTDERVEVRGSQIISSIGRVIRSLLSASQLIVIIGKPPICHWPQGSWYQ